MKRLLYFLLSCVLTSSVAWASSESSATPAKHFSREEKFAYLCQGIYFYYLKKKRSPQKTGNAAVQAIVSFMKKDKKGLNKTFKVPLNFNPNILTKNFNYAYTLSHAEVFSPKISKTCYPQLIEFPSVRADNIDISIISAKPMHINLYPPSCRKAAEYLLCISSIKNRLFNFISPKLYDLLLKNSKFIDKENQKVLRSRFPIAANALIFPYNFRKMTWGMNVNDVMQKEKLLMYRISNGIYRSNSFNMDGLETILQYRFKNSKLCSGSYIISIKSTKSYMSKLYYCIYEFGKFHNILSKKYGYPTRKSFLLWKDKPCNDMSKWDNMFDTGKLKIRDEWKLKNVHVSITLQKKQSEAELIIEYSSPEFASLSQNVSAGDAL